MSSMPLMRWVTSILLGGSGSDTITGSSQDDVIWGDGYDVADPRSYDGTMLSASQ